jgi:hypothetical protein
LEYFCFSYLRVKMSLIIEIIIKKDFDWMICHFSYPCYRTYRTQDGSSKMHVLRSTNDLLKMLRVRVSISYHNVSRKLNADHQVA